MLDLYRKIHGSKFYDFYLTYSKKFLICQLLEAKPTNKQKKILLIFKVILNIKNVCLKISWFLWFRTFVV